MTAKKENLGQFEYHGPSNHATAWNKAVTLLEMANDSGAFKSVDIKPTKRNLDDEFAIGAFAVIAVAK